MGEAFQRRVIDGSSNVQKRRFDTTKYHRAGYSISILAFAVNLGFLIFLVLGGLSSRMAEASLGWAGGRI